MLLSHRNLIRNLRLQRLPNSISAFSWIFMKFNSSVFSPYIQGQSPADRIREYFYFIDHEGQLFLDDAKIKNFTSCYKEKKFLQFFITRIKINDLIPERYPEFPFISPCGRERNFIRCDDRPIVFTELQRADSTRKTDMLSYNGAGDLLQVEFIPELLKMDPKSGRVYYPSPNLSLGMGLVKSSLAMELSRFFEYENADESRPPKWIRWRNDRILLKN